MNAEIIARHVLRALASAQVRGIVVDLSWLASEVPVRRRDLRSAVTALHRAGLVDALRMRLSLRGFAIGFALRAAELPALRTPKQAGTVAA
jgi:hypothetical protein